MGTARKEIRLPPRLFAMVVLVTPARMGPLSYLKIARNSREVKGIP
jgi:hypothetical protein